MALTRNSFISHRGDANIVWVNPRSVNTITGSKWPVTGSRVKKLRLYLPHGMVLALRPWLTRSEPFFTPSDAFAVGGPINETEKYKRVANFIACKNDIKASDWFEMLARQLSETGVAHHKSRALRSQADILRFLEGYARDVVDNMANSGFSPRYSGYESTAVINADGSICKSASGNHRFCIASVLGLDRFPLKVIGAHQDWRPDLVEAGTLDDILKALKSVEARHQ